MKLEGSRVIKAEPAAVWAALNDPDVLKACVPGCESLERKGDNGFEAVVKQKVGPVSATFKGDVQLSNLNPPHGYTITGQGNGGVAGMAKGGADVSLAPAEGGGTLLTYAVDAQVAGKIAQLGARLIDSFAKSMADKFFETFAQTVEGTGPAPDAPAPEGEKKGFWKRLVG